MNPVIGLLSLLFSSIILVNASESQRSQQRILTRYNKLSDDQDVDWWKSAVIYQIYPKSFKDSNNDGNGDLQGIIQKLDHLKDLDVDAIWLNSIFKSPQVDNGYDISDYRDIDPIYGTLEELRQLLDEAHKLNIKLLLDYVPNHTSDQHEWFQASVKRDPQYEDYYMWQNATYVNGERRPPNNWISCFNGPAWEWNEIRQQYYFHQFSTSQPDLNYRNSVVVEEMKDVLKYWLGFGIDGFTMTSVTTLFEDILLTDEPESGVPGIDSNDYDYLIHNRTIDQPENFDMIYQWRAVLDEFNVQNKTYDRIMITEGSADPNTILLFYQNLNGSQFGAHFTFNFLSFLSILKNNFTSTELANAIVTFWDVLYVDSINNFPLGNRDYTRVSTRLGIENVDALNMLISILHGAQIIYQGEEIGQENGNVTCEEGTDPQAIKNCSTFATRSRDFERTPFQWDNSTNAGFNDGAKPWLPVSDKYVGTNLAQQNIPDVNTHYNIYKQMLKVRREFQGDHGLDFVGVGYYIHLTIFYAQRWNDDAEYMFYYNVGDSEQVLTDPICENCMTVAVRSINSEYLPGDKFNLSQPLKPKEAVLYKVKRVNQVNL